MRMCVLTVTSGVHLTRRQTVFCMRWGDDTVVRVQAEGAAGGAEAEARRQAQREEAAAREAAVAAAAREEAAKREAERKKAVQVRWLLLTPGEGFFFYEVAMLCHAVHALHDPCYHFPTSRWPVASGVERFGLLVYP